MNKKQLRFFNNYHEYFQVDTYEECRKCWDALSKEEQKKLKDKMAGIKGAKFNREHPEFRKQCMAHTVGKKRDPEVGKKVSEALKKYYEDPKNREKTSKALKKAFKENPKSKESCKKQAESLRKTFKEHPELKEKISKTLKKKWAEDKEYREMICSKTKKAMEEFYKTEKGQENLKKWTNGSRAKGTSKPEKEIQEFVKSIYKGKIICNNRKILGNGYELDIYVPDKNVAIEHDGIIWHSEAYKKERASVCHLYKTKMCEEKGIRLIHIFSDEWENKKEICKSIIASSLGIYQKKYFARKLTFKQTTYQETKNFFETNHIQGSSITQFYFGLYDGNELIQAISIGQNRFSRKNKNLELVRMATLLNCQVVGGFSKLIKNTKLKPIETYVDRRLFDAKSYLSTGWIKIGESSPGYFYTDGKERFHRLKYTKQKCIKMWGDSGKTEKEMCREHNLFQLYDCGTIKLIYN